MSRSTPAPKVSVCVPTYNRADFLRECVTTLLQQTASDYEIVVVDNHSTDATPALVSTLFTDPRVRFVRNPENIGSRGNWNRCIELAEGEYVAICHDDDLYAPDFVASCSRFLDAHPSVGFVHCGATLTDVTGKPTRHVLAYPSDRVLPSREIFRSFLEDLHNVAFSSVMARRSAYLDVGPFPTEYLCADYDMWLRLAYRFDVGYISRPLVVYRAHDGSTSQTLPPMRWYEENREIVDRAIAMAMETMPELATERLRIQARVKTCWARRCLREALSRISYGNLAGAEAYLAVAASLATGPVLRMKIALAKLLRSPLGARALLCARTGWQHVRCSRLYSLLAFGRLSLNPPTASR